MIFQNGLAKRGRFCYNAAREFVTILTEARKSKAFAPKKQNYGENK